jgi:hypothetical protein
LAASSFHNVLEKTCLGGNLHLSTLGRTSGRAAGSLRRTGDRAGCPAAK